MLYVNAKKKAEYIIYGRHAIKQKTGPRINMY